MDITLTILAQALAFAGLIWLVATKIWPPLLQAIEMRQKTIADGLEAADRGQRALEQAQTQVDEIMQEARQKAGDIIEQAHSRASQIMEQARADAIAEANRQKEHALVEIDAAQRQARDQLRQQVSNLAVLGAERLLKREIDAKAHQGLLDELVTEL